MSSFRASMYCTAKMIGVVSCICIIASCNETGSKPELVADYKSKIASDFEGQPTKVNSGERRKLAGQEVGFHNEYPSSIELVSQDPALLIFGGPIENFELGMALLREGNVELARLHLEVSASIGMPEARYELALIHGGGHGYPLVSKVDEYVWYRVAHRRSGIGDSYKDSKLKADELMTSLSDLELQIANFKIAQIDARTRVLYNAVFDKRNSHLSGQHK